MTDTKPWCCTGYVAECPLCPQYGTSLLDPCPSHPYTGENQHVIDVARLHAERRHPDWEYATTRGPRKQRDSIDRPPASDDCDPDYTWERNVDAGRPGQGWDRFDYTEESYWRRPKNRQTGPVDVDSPRAADKPARTTPNNPAICELPHQTIEEEDACEQQRLTTLDARAYAVRSRLLAEAFGRTLARHGYDEVHELVLHSLADTAQRAIAADRQRAEAAESALARYRAWLAAEHAKAVAADRARDCPADLRVSPHNGIAAGLAIALHGADHLLTGHTPPGPAGTEATKEQPDA